MSIVRLKDVGDLVAPTVVVALDGWVPHGTFGHPILTKGPFSVSLPPA